MKSIIIYTVSDGDESYFTDTRASAVAKFDEMKATAPGGKPFYSEDIYDPNTMDARSTAELEAILKAESADVSKETREKIEIAIRCRREQQQNASFPR